MASRSEPAAPAVEVPAPRENALLFGQDAAEAALVRAVRGGRMHHAWLLAGPDGIGKATLAFRFARWLLAGAPGERMALDATHPVFRRVAAGTHADLLTVEREWDPKRKRLRGEIVVEDVRGIADFLHRTPAEGGWRVVVLDGAEHLNRNAANALLKVLEEPPARAVLLVVASAPGRLLATIRSRCRRLPLAPLDPASMAAAMAALLPGLAAPERARLTALAEGAPGRAVDLATGHGLALASLVEEVLAALPAVDTARAHAVADALAGEETSFGTFMDLLRAALSAAVRAAGRGGASQAQARLAALRPLDAWTDVWHALAKIQDETERFHLDKRQAIVAGLAVLAGA